MKQVIVRYRVKPDRAEENLALVRAVFAELERDRPARIRYTTMRGADGVSFVHLARIETTDDSNPLQAVEAFKAFSAAIKDRCEEPPVSMVVEEVGAYRMFDTTP